MDEFSSDSACTRRTLLRAGAGVAAATAAAGATGSAVAQDAPYDGYLSDVGNFDGTTADMTGQDQVTIQVGSQGNGGAFAFGPPAVQVDPGTTVVWEWTGQGGQHNVVDEAGAFESELTAEGGFTFEYTFDEEGVVKYYCLPHRALGMKGVVAVGDSAQGQTGGGGGDGGDGGDGGGGPPDFGGYLDDVGNFDGSVTDARGQSEVTVGVGTQGNGGAFAFDPPAVHVDAGTTVVWEWTGQGGQHNVVHEGGNFESELVSEEGFTFEHTFESDGVYNYYCQPHRALGMKASVVVGSDYPTTGGGGDGGGGDGAGDGDGPQEETAANQTAARTLMAMLALGFLSPLVFLLVVRRKLRQRPRQA
jgi:halocyanin-like protein